MDKCLIVLDMDGTLLNKRKEISLLTKNYLLELSNSYNVLTYTRIYYDAS